MIIPFSGNCILIDVKQKTYGRKERVNIMKTLDVFIKEIKASKELQEELKKVKDMVAADAFLKAHNCDATAEELSDFIKSQINDGQGELSDDDASSVTGGVWMDVGAGWIDVDDTIPVRKTSPVLPDMRIDIIED